MATTLNRTGGKIDCKRKTCRLRNLAKSATSCSREASHLSACEWESAVVWLAAIAPIDLNEEWGRERETDRETEEHLRKLTYCCFQLFFISWNGIDLPSEILVPTISPLCLNNKKSERNSSEREREEKKRQVPSAAFVMSWLQRGSQREICLCLLVQTYSGVFQQLPHTRAWSVRGIKLCLLSPLLFTSTIGLPGCRQVLSKLYPLLVKCSKNRSSTARWGLNTIDGCLGMYSAVSFFCMFIIGSGVHILEHSRKEAFIYNVFKDHRIYLGEKSW